MMAVIGPCCRRIVSLQELVEGGFFCQVFHRLGIEGLHLLEFFRHQSREMANEVDQLPTVLILRWITLSPGRHGSEANTITDDPEEFSIRHRLRSGQPEVRCFGVDVLAIRRLAAPVVRMAGRTMVGEVREPFLQYVGTEGKGIGHIALLEGYGEMPDLARHEHLDRMRLCLRAKAGGEQLVTKPDSDRTDRGQADEQECEEFRA